MAKKTKLRKNLAAAVVVTTLVVVGGGGVSYKLYRNRIRPGQLMTEARAAVAKNDWIAAGNALSRMGDRMATDAEYLTLMYEARNRQTSFKDTGMRDALQWLEGTLATLPRNVPMLSESLKFHFTRTEFAGFDIIGPDDAHRIQDASDKILEAEPNNPLGIRGRALTKALPIFQQNATLSSADTEKTIDELRTMLDAAPDNPDLLIYYAFAHVKLRDTLARERAIPENGVSPRLQAMFDDLDARVAALLKAAGDASRPAAYRGVAYTRAYRADQILGVARLTDDKDRLAKVNVRRAESLANAAALLPADSELYVPMRYEQATALANVDKIAEAEALLRDTVAGDPYEWQPRLLLADFLSEHDRPADALETLSADLKPSTELTGLRGSQFFADNRQVPARRALVRLQSLAKIPADQREGEIIKAQTEYDTAVANNSGANFEAQPFVMQVKAGLLEVRNDRTGAVQLLNRALESNPPDRLKLRIMQQLVVLNLALNQPGAASAMLEKVMQASPDMQSVLQLIDLRIKNNDMEQAKTLIEQAKRASPGNPALLALEIRTMAGPAEKRAALAKFPEDTPQLSSFKMRFAASTDVDDEPTVKRIAEAALKAEPGAVEPSIIYGDYLRRHDRRDEGLKLLKAALEKHPENQSLALLIKDTETKGGDRPAMITDIVKDPFQRAMLQADQARLANDFETYKAKLIEADGLDKDNKGDASERLFLFYLAANDTASAEASLNKFSKSGRDPSQLRTHRIRLAMAKGNVDDAAAQADALIADLPNFAPGWVAKGQTHQARGQYDQAINAFQTALNGQPENIEALRGMIESSARLGRQDLLKRAIDTGLRVTKGDEYFTDASLRYQLAFGDPTQTVAPRTKLRDANPTDPNAWLALAQSYAASAADREKKGDAAGVADYKKKTLQLFREAMAKFPDTSGFTLEAANQLHKSGDVAGAFQLVDAMNDNPKFANDPQAQAQRIDFYSAHGKQDVAQQLLESMVKAGKATDQMKGALASYQVQQGKPDEALATLADVKDSVPVRQLKMNVLIGAKRLDEASTLVNDALKKERSGPNLVMAALVLGEQQKLSEAIKLADEAVALDPDNTAARYARAQFALNERPVRNNDVINDLQVVRKNTPGNVEARLILADRLQATNRPAEALQELESLQREFPGNLVVAIKLIQNYAAERTMRMNRIDPIFAEAKKNGLGNDPRLLALETVVATQNKDMPRAIEAARKAAQANPDDIGLFRSFLGTLINAGANKEVIGELDRIERASGSLYWTYLTRGIALHRLKQEDQAAQQFDRAIGIALSLKDNVAAINEIASNYAIEYGAEPTAAWLKSKMPDNVDTQLMLMRILTNGGKLDKAIAVGEHLLANASQLPTSAQTQILASLGTSYLAVNPPKPAEAVQAFTKLDQIEPNNMMTLNNLAYAMTLEGSGATIRQALEYAKKANDLSVTNASPNVYIMDTYGWTLVQANEVDEGLKVLQAAIQVQDIPEVDYHLGEALIVKQRKVEALQSLQNGLANITKAKNNGQTVDPSLEMRINDAINRAQMIVTAP